MGACKECGCKDGDRGPMGPSGLKGDTGAAGPTGNVGIQGPIGINGIQGIQGVQGIQGIQGIPGNSVGGTTGATGGQGNVGPQGIAGNDGADGADGTNGINGRGRLNYVINAFTSSDIHPAILNEGIIMKNTGFCIVQLPSGANIGDTVQVVGTATGTGGWRINTDGADTIEMTNQTPLLSITQAGGYLEPQSTNYRDVITIVSDGTGRWIAVNALLANQNQPLFS